jgi:hypothetical protein
MKMSEKKARKEAKKTSQVPHTNVKIFLQLKEFFFSFSAAKKVAGELAKERKNLHSP